MSDCISTAVVLLTVVIAKLFGVNADGYATIFVAAFIAWSGIGILKETLSKLIGHEVTSCFCVVGMVASGSNQKILSKIQKS